MPRSPDDGAANRPRREFQCQRELLREAGTWLDDPMHVDDAETRLRDMLCEAGIDGARDSDWEHLRPATAGDVAKAWEIFTRFAEQPVEGVDPEGGDVDASYGVYDWHQGRGEQFQLKIGRGYVFLGEDGEYDYSATLNLEFLYTPTPELLALGS